MTVELGQVCCARLPATALAALADLRREPTIRVTPAGDHAWVRWEACDEAVLMRLLPVSGVELYGRRGDLWYRPGAHLPSFGVPEEAAGRAISLARAVTPGPIRASRGGHDPSTWTSTSTEPVRLALAREATPRDASALRCRLVDLGPWAEMATLSQLGALLAAQAGDVVLLLGQRPPPVAGERFWGAGLLSPLGFRPDPWLPESSLRRALGVDDGEIVVLDADGFEAIPRDAFRPLTRAGVRLASGGEPPS